MGIGEGTVPSWHLGLAVRGVGVGHWVALEGGYRGGQHPNSLLGTPQTPVLISLLA